MEHDYKGDAGRLRAFCDENRLKILVLLQGGEKCGCVLLDALEVGQSTLSHHMKILCDCGIVSSRREGKWAHYSISPRGCGDAVALLATYIGGVKT